MGNYIYADSYADISDIEGVKSGSNKYATPTEYKDVLLSSPKILYITGEDTSNPYLSISHVFDDCTYILNIDGTEYDNEDVDNIKATIDSSKVLLTLEPYSGAVLENSEGTTEYYSNNPSESFQTNL